ncbi:MAG: purine-nucleoside phosphorylase, partial [Trueperaceae bacterium]
GVRAAQVAFPVRVMHALGAERLLVSNACGGLNPHWRAGDLMLQLDFVNHTGQNPLIGPNDDRLGPRFPVAFDAYDPTYLELVRATARRLDVPLREGVYLAISGPSYATRAELRAFRAWGADAIGMSTVFEVLTARHEGMRVVGLSTVTDMALPDVPHHADHEEVLRVAAASGATFRRLVRAVVPDL